MLFTEEAAFGTDKNSSTQKGLEGTSQWKSALTGAHEENPFYA